MRSLCVWRSGAELTILSFAVTCSYSRWNEDRSAHILSRFPRPLLASAPLPLLSAPATVLSLSARERLCPAYSDLVQLPTLDVQRPRVPPKLPSRRLPRSPLPRSPPPALPRSRAYTSQLDRMRHPPPTPRREARMSLRRPVPRSTGATAAKSGQCQRGRNGEGAEATDDSGDDMGECPGFGGFAGWERWGWCGAWRLEDVRGALGSGRTERWWFELG